MVVLVALVINALINSPLWQNETKVLTLVTGVILLAIVVGGLSIWYPYVNRTKHQHQIIQRYLKWAEQDLKEEQPF
jgi:hypothetical protein